MISIKKIQEWQSLISIVVVGVSFIVWDVNSRAEAAAKAQVIAQNLEEFKIDTRMHIDKLDLAIEKMQQTQNDTAASLKVLCALFDERTARQTDNGGLMQPKVIK